MTCVYMDIETYVKFTIRNLTAATIMVTLFNRKTYLYSTNWWIASKLASEVTYVVWVKGDTALYKLHNDTSVIVIAKVELRSYTFTIYPYMQHNFPIQNIWSLTSPTWNHGDNFYIEGNYIPFNMGGIL